MSQSSLVEYTLLSPFCTKPRVYPITKITIHHMAGNMSIEQCGRVFQSRQACSQYGIDGNGRVGQYCLEENRAWCSANYDNDHRAINIEVANDGGAPNWHVSDKALAKLIDLCVDICKRNGIKKLNYTGDKNGNLTMHQFFVATACPGPYLKSKFPWIAEEVNKRLEGKVDTDTDKQTGKLYRVQIGAFKLKRNALKLAAELNDKGYATIVKNVGPFYKVQLGAFSVKANAENFLKKIKNSGFSSAFLVSD